MPIIGTGQEICVEPETPRYSPYTSAMRDNCRSEKDESQKHEMRRRLISQINENG